MPRAIFLPAFAMVVLEGALSGPREEIDMVTTPAGTSSWPTTWARASSLSSASAVGPKSSRLSSRRSRRCRSRRVMVMAGVLLMVAGTLLGPDKAKPRPEAGF